MAGVSIDQHPRFRDASALRNRGDDARSRAAERRAQTEALEARAATEVAAAEARASADAVAVAEAEVANLNGRLAALTNDDTGE